MRLFSAKERYLSRRQRVGDSVGRVGVLEDEEEGVGESKMALGTSWCSGMAAAGAN